MGSFSQVKKLIAGAVVVTALSIAAVIPAFADSVTGTIGVTGGSLSMATTDNPAFGSVALDGSDKTASDATTIDAKDNTGTGAGWKLQVSATRFSNGNPLDPKTLPANALSITSASAACDGIGTCTAPTSAVTSLATVGTTSATFFNAAAGTGMGDFTVTPTFQVTVPANVYADTYTSTVTLTLASAP